MFENIRVHCKRFWSFKRAKIISLRSGAVKASKFAFFSQKLADFRFPNFENGAFEGDEHEVGTDLCDLFYGSQSYFPWSIKTFWRV